MRIAVGLLSLALVFASSSRAAADLANPTEDSTTIVTGGGHDVEVIVENDGGEIVVVVGGRECTYRKARVGELVLRSGIPYVLVPEQGVKFIREIRNDDRVFFLYLRVCGNAAGIDPPEFLWLEETPPADVIERARQELIRIAPDPVAGFSPDATLRQLVGLATFVWLDETTLQPIVVEASIPGLTATATATPSRLVLDPGDGSGLLECELDVTPYTEGSDPDSNCTHTFERVSSLSATGTWDFTVVLEWDVTWVNSLGETGVADPLETQSIYPLTVIEAQARTTNG